MWRIRPARHLWQTNCPAEGMLPKTSRFSSQFLYLISLGLVLFRSPYSLNTSLPCDSLRKGARSLAGRDRVACELACAFVLLSSRASREVKKFEKCKNVALLCSFPWDFASETIHRACIHVIGRFIRASHFRILQHPFAIVLQHPFNCKGRTVGIPFQAQNHRSRMNFPNGLHWPVKIFGVEPILTQSWDIYCWYIKKLHFFLKTLREFILDFFFGSEVIILDHYFLSTVGTCVVPQWNRENWRRLILLTEKKQKRRTTIC